MTAYTSCRGCLVDRHKCAHRKTIRSAIAGLCITSIKFSCPHRVARFRDGQRVAVMWKFLVAEDARGDLEEVRFKATVLGETKPGRFHLRVDDGPCYDCESDPNDWIAPDCLIGNGYASATYTRLAAIDEPDCAVCSVCGGLGDDDCYQNNSMKNCLLNQAT